MDLVICMAGKNTRFHDWGIDSPKYLLPFDGSFVIKKILEELLNARIFTNVHLIAHLRDKTFRPKLEDVMKELDLNPENIFYIGETSGQAETAYLASELIHGKTDRPIVFHNADTVLIGRDLNDLRRYIGQGYGVIDVFRATSPNYSYVKLENLEVIEIVEKVAISDFATSGLYGFDSSFEFRNAFTEIYRNRGEAKSELFISDVISYLLEQGKTFKVNLEGNDSKKLETLVLGTPSEYNSTVLSFHGQSACQ